MDPERWAGLETLISLAKTCTRLREVCRGLLFRCIRIGSVVEAREVISRKDDWGKYVRYVGFFPCLDREGKSWFSGRSLTLLD